MMLDILSRNICRNVRYLDTTITENNSASIAMFSKLAHALNAADINRSVLFDKQKHFAGLHDSEVLFHIGPFNYHLLKS
jgi:L-2,4-diaminobutyric acid acetyltransferase